MQLLCYDGFQQGKCHDFCGSFFSLCPDVWQIFKTDGSCYLKGASHRTSVGLGKYCITPRVCSQCSLSPSWRCVWHDFCTGLMAWTECQSHLESYGVMLFYFSAICCCSVQQIIFTSGNCGICMHLCLLQLCFAALSPVWIPPSLTQKSAIVDCHAAPLATSCLQHLFSGRLK